MGQPGRQAAARRPKGTGPRALGQSRRGRRPGIPDLDEVIARLQSQARRFMPGGGGGGRGGNGRLLALLGIVAVAIWLGTGFYRVQPDEQGVVLRFGAFRGYTYPGLQYHIPWPVEEVLTPAVTRVNRIEVGVRSPARPKPGHPLPRRGRRAGSPGRGADADRRREHHRHQLLGVLARQGRRRLPVQHAQPGRDHAAPPRKA